MNALLFACPTCGAQPGEPCVADFATPRFPLGRALSEPHMERCEVAFMAAPVDGHVHVATDAEIAAAVDGVA